MARIRIVLAIFFTWAATEIAGPGQLAAQPAPKKPVVERSPLLKEPTTPEEMFAATVLMVDLARFDLAALYLEQFESTSPDDELLLKLRDKHGTSEFVKLALTKELQPGSRELLDRLNAAARIQAADPAFVDQLVGRLFKSPTERDLATAELRNAGVQVVPEILRQMGQSEMADEQDTFVIALFRMGPQVVPAVIGALDTPDERIRAAMIDLLGMFDAVDAIPYLWYPAFDEQQPAGIQDAAKTTLAKLLRRSNRQGMPLSSVTASNELKRLAKMLYRSTELLPVDEEDGTVKLWTWVDGSDTIAEKSMTPEVAALFLSTRFARQSLALSPDLPEPQRQYLASLLGLEVLRHGWDHPRVAEPGTALYLGLTAGEETVSDVLADALEARQPATAVPALEILSQIGTREQLLSRGGTKSPVLAAINSSDPRVQFAAATTILKLDPKNGFTNSQRIVGILARALTDTEQPRAIVIDSDGSRASVTSGFLNQGGYAGTIGATGREGFQLASTLTGVEVVLVHVNCQRWDLTQTLSNLRSDARTAQLPIVIYGPGSLETEMARTVARYAPAAFIAESSTASDFLAQLVPSLQQLHYVPLSVQERGLQKNAAAYWLATIASGNLGKVFDITPAEKPLSIAVEDPEIATNALVALSGVGTQSAQLRLADIALNSNFEDGLRQTAANQLAYHIQHYGLMLTTDEIIKVHTGWRNADSPMVKAALASVIGSFKPNAAVVSERLRQFPVPVAN